MKKFTLLIACILFFSTGCVLTGRKGTNYGGNVRMPNDPATVRIKPPVPQPNSTSPELSLDQLYKTYYAPYSSLFTTTLRAVEALNLSVKGFNSTSGLIEFRTIQGYTYFLKVAPDQEFNSRSTVKLFSKDGSRRINKNLVESIFQSINYHLNVR